MVFRRRRFGRRKRVFRRRFRRRDGQNEKRFYKNVRKVPDVVYKPMSLYTNPLPPSYFCKFSLDFSYYYLTTGSSVMMLDFCANDLMTPLNTYRVLQVGDGVNTSILDGANITTLKPVSASKLINADLYKNFIVYANKITVKALPCGLGDNCQIVVAPFQMATLGAVTGTSGFSRVCNFPYAKYKFFSAGQDLNNGITSYMTTAKMFSMSPAEVRAAKNVTYYSYSRALGGQYNATIKSNNNGSYLNCWGWLIGLREANDSAPIQKITVNVSQTYWVECFNQEAMELDLV